MRLHRLVWACLGAVLVAVWLAMPAAAQTATLDPRLAEARRLLFDELDYERGVETLGRILADLEGRRDAPGAEDSLVEAYELRGRTFLGLGRTEEARADFQTLVRLRPAHRLTGQVSPRIVAFFDETRLPMVGNILLALEPADARLTLDGRPFEAIAGAIEVIVGTRVIEATREGYAPLTHTVEVRAGETTTVTLTMARTSATVAVVTAPAGVEVVIDGVARGRTEPGGLRPDFEGWDRQLGVAPEDFSAPFVVGELGLGPHTVLLRRDCYVPIERRVDVERFGDFRLDPLKLEPAVGAIAVDSRVPGAIVILDGERRGAAPMTIADVCEGPHVLEVATSYGRDLRRLDVKMGERISIVASPRPVFALLQTTGVPAGQRGPDLRLAVERALGEAAAVTVQALPAEAVERAMARLQVPAGWLAFDAGLRPLDDEAGRLTSASRRDAGTKLAAALEVQGVAAVSVPPGGAPDQVLVSLLAAEATEPDVLDIRLDDPESLALALSGLAALPPLFRATVGLSAIDVLDQDGPVTTSGTPEGTIAVGEVVLEADGQPVATASELRRAVERAEKAGKTVLTVRSVGAQPRQVELPIVREPRLVTVGDQLLRASKAIVELRTRLVGTSGAEAQVIRLNLAGALIQAGSFAEARAELTQIDLPEGPGVGAGTVQYMLGLCAEGLGQATDARRHFQAAQASASWLTEDGPPVADLAARRLR